MWTCTRRSTGSSWRPPGEARASEEVPAWLGGGTAVPLQGQPRPLRSLQRRPASLAEQPGGVAGHHFARWSSPSPLDCSCSLTTGCFRQGLWPGTGSWEAPSCWHISPDGPSSLRDLQSTPDAIPESGVEPPPLDTAWVEATRKKALLKLEKLDTDLKNYKGNSIKESIRCPPGWARAGAGMPATPGRVHSQPGPQARPRRPG